MTTTPAPSITSHALTGTVLGPFPTQWRFSEPADGTVLLSLPTGQTPLSPPDYVLTAVAPLVGGGTVMLSPALLPSGGWPVEAELILMRRTARRQGVALPDTEGHKPRATEAALDRAMRIAEEDRDDLSRTWRAAPGDLGLETPSPAGRPGNGLFFDQDDRPYWGKPFSGGPISAFFQALITAGNSALALFGLGIATPGAWGAKGDGVFEDTAALNLAGASGQKVRLMGRTYRTTNKVVLRSGTAFVGPGRIIPTAVGANPWVVEIAAGENIQLIGVDIDGAALGGAAIYGVRADGSTRSVRVQGCNIRNLGFTGIDLSAGGGDLTHIDARVEDNTVENVGWIGINVEKTTGHLVARNTVKRTGYHGIFCISATDGKVSHNHVNKSTPPDHIYNGPGGLGGVEGGFMIGYDPTVNRLIIDSNLCIDNRNAGYDGIGVGEDGVTEFGPTVISNNIVRRAGLFGIDPVGNVVVTGNFIDEAKEQGIHIGLDLGGMLRNVLVSSNIVRNTGDEPGKYAILVGDTLGPALTVRDVRIVNNLVLDTRAVRNTQYGVAVVSDEATYEGLAIIGNDLSGVADTSLTLFGTNGPGADYEAWGNKCVGDERTPWTAVATPATGAFGAHTASGRFQRVGKTVHLRGRLQIPTAGSAGGAVSINLPVPSRPGTNFAMTAMQGNTAEPIYAVAAGSTLVLAKSGGATIAANGVDLFFSGEYEAAS